jgi:hypothetical protein
MSITLVESIRRARSRRLLEGYSVYATPNVVPAYDILKRLVEYSGGKVSSINPT